MAEDDNHRVVRDKSSIELGQGDPDITKLFYCKTGLRYPLMDDYCSRNLSLAKITKSPHSFLFYKIPERKNIAFIDNVELPQRLYFQLHIAFIPPKESFVDLPVNLVPNKREANLYYSKDPKKDWNIFTDPMVNRVNCQMFVYGGEYKVPVEAKKGKLLIDIYPNECKEDVNRNKYTVFVNFEPGKTYELKIIQNLERSKKANEPIFDISLLEMQSEIDTKEITK